MTAQPLPGPDADRVQPVITGLAPVPDPAGAGSGGRRARGPIPITRATAAKRVAALPTVELSDRVRRLWDQAADASRRLAIQYSDLAPYWGGRDLEGADRDRAEVADMTIAAAYQLTLRKARFLIRDAHRSVDLLPGVCERLADGELATDWHHQILTRTGDFTDAEMGLVDEEVAVWDLAMTPEGFTRELKKLVTRILARRALPPDLAPENQRRVEALPARDDGTGCVRVIGPIPEMLAYMRRLDQAARAVQLAQQQAFQARVDAALADGDVDPASIPVPFDPDRTVAETGRPLSLAQIRERLVLTARFDTDGVPVPAARFRINVTIPALTLLGADDEPGMLDGTIPIPAAMAKDLAAGEPTWYRVLTDPSDGEFLPLPADRYQPTAAMREHLRLRHSTCTVPGCGRPVRDGVEFDHIDEYDRTGQGDGGATEVENLHGLCMVHHGMKTGRVIDPIRAGSDESPSGVPGIWWELSDQIRWFTQDHTDLATTDTATAYENAWRKHRECRERHEHAHDTTSGTSPGGTPPGNLDGPNDSGGSPTGLESRGDPGTSPPGGTHDPGTSPPPDGPNGSDGWVDRLGPPPF
jgi:hypothetical protein